MRKRGGGRGREGGNVVEGGKATWRSEVGGKSGLKSEKATQTSAVKAESEHETPLQPVETKFEKTSAGLKGEKTSAVKVEVNHRKALQLRSKIETRNKMITR